jgi:hypothetical protein
MWAMSEQTGMSCGEFADVAAELALGVLTGRERAFAVAHLDQCDSCREYVRQLSLTGEEMLGLLPSREPSEGFESRVMARLGVAAPPPPGAVPQPSLAPSSSSHPSLAGRPGRKTPKWYTRRMLTVAAAALAVVACGLGGWALRGATAPAGGGSTAQSPLREATLTSATHQSEGKVYLYDDSPRWLYMGVDTHSSSNDTVVCQLVERDGKVITIGSFSLKGGYGAWGSPDPIAASDVTGARLISSDGMVLASASFSAAH